MVQKCHDAYAAQPDLPKDLAKEGIVNPLGMEPYDWFVLSALTAAGITVECCHKDPACAEMYDARQIVDATDFKLFMDNKSMEHVRLVDKEDMHGLSHNTITDTSHLLVSALATRARLALPALASSLAQMHTLRRYSMDHMVHAHVHSALTLC